MRQIFLVLLVLFPVISNSQTFTMIGASATFYNAGEIIFTDDNGKFRTDAAAITANAFDNVSGTVTFQGTDNLFTDETDATGTAGALGTSATRVTGFVKYQGLGATINVQDDLYLTNLEAASTSTTITRFGNAVNVDGEYVISGGGVRDYATSSNTFTYDGASTTQTILGETYYDLAFEQAAVKFIPNSETVIVENDTYILANNTAGVTLQGNFQAGVDFDLQAGAGQIFVDGAAGNTSMTFGSGVNLVSADIMIDDAGGANTAVVRTGTGEVTVDATGLVTVESGTFQVNDGDLTIADGGSFVLTDLNGNIEVGTGRVFTVNGDGFTNSEALATRTNMLFDDASTVVYNDGGEVQGSIESNPYGTLGITGTANTDEAGDNTIFVSEDFYVEDNNFDISSGATTSSTLTMLDVNASATYGSGIELVGRMDRVVTGISTTLTYNNEATLVFVDDLGNTPVSIIGLDVRPASNSFTDANQATFDYDTSRDIDRVIRLYHNNGSNTFDMDLTYGYLPSEDNNIAPEVEETLRFREDDGNGGSEKVSTGNTPDRNATTAPFRTVTLQGINNPVNTGTLAQVDNGGILFLRGGPTIYISINSGRWSNPNTWDEGEQPTHEDIAVVRHNVHIGFVRPNDGVTTNEQIRLNGLTGSPTVADGLAHQIIVDEDYGDLAGTPTEIATLYVGGNGTFGTYSDNTSTLIAAEDQGSIYLDSRSTGNDAFAFDVENESSVSGNATDFNRGLVIFAGATFIINGNATNNNNAVNNAGTIQINN